MTKTMMPDAKFYVARRDTRWDVYPQQQPQEIVAHDWWGFWAKAADGSWFKSPVSYRLERQITKQEAERDIDSAVGTTFGGLRHDYNS